MNLVGGQIKMTEFEHLNIEIRLHFSTFINIYCIAVTPVPFHFYDSCFIIWFGCKYVSSVTSCVYLFIYQMT